MALARLDNLAVRLPEKVIAEPDRLVDRTRHPEGARVAGDPHDGAQHHRRQAETRITRDNRGEPTPADPMWRHSPREGIHKEIHTGEDHSKVFSRRISSRSSISGTPEKSVSSIPGIGPPVALLIRGWTRL